MKKKNIDYIKLKNVLKILRYGLVVGESPDMVWLLGEVPIWFVSWGKSRDCLFPGGSPDMVLSPGKVPRLFSCWGKSQDVTSRHI